ncbi:acetoin utilization protein AcuC [Heliophilum fasciatum]|uniref:Acetoin utilization protein AcuC n=1 Tax=Heliophilum fasciatum TaxID=35700 RepID=A0A4R2RMG4_9FIRM|nr:acetoin utilization protein AcuC [Heliophilum fasciatum]MCW2278512.1 acetoin utilization protein AcuC [Heliophilum fasciatum]TCP63467.1 acetoin utilization protein AcuC [Heliophilum fasciatum]
MIKRPRLIYSDAFKSYEFAPDHPFHPLRIELAMDMIRYCNWLKDDQIVPPEPCTREDLLTVHPTGFVDAVHAASTTEVNPLTLRMYGLGTDDTPVFPGMDDAARLVVGATLQGAKMIMEGQTDHVFQIAGGLHHAHRHRASGFCIYNDAAVAIAYLQRQHGLRVAYIDTDAHHGDGVQSIFYDDPSVLTISIHETGRYLFPGTGNVEERGRFDGYGFSVNLPLEAYTEDDSFLELYEQSVGALLEAFQPDFLITQNGVDAHHLDPLTHLCLTTRSYVQIPRLAHQWAHKYCKGRWLAIGGGGYDHWRVVSRAWPIVWAEMNEINDYGPIPEAWMQKWQSQSPVDLPPNILDGEDDFAPMPRRAIITDKNRTTLQRVMRDAQKLVAERHTNE